MRVRILIMCAIVIMGVSCKKDSQGNNILGTKMSATIDSKAWDSAIRTTVMKTIQIQQVNTNVLIITATSLTGEILEITTYGTTQGTYELTISIPTKVQCLATFKALSSGTEYFYTSTTGTVVLSKVDKTNKKISGTFAFSLYSVNSTTKTVTNGVFNDLSYTEQ